VEEDFVDSHVEEDFAEEGFVEEVSFHLEHRMLLYNQSLYIGMCFGNHQIANCMHQGIDL